MNALQPLVMPSFRERYVEPRQNAMLASMQSGAAPVNAMAPMYQPTSAPTAPPAGPVMRGQAPEGDIFSYDGLNIEYRGDPDFIYGRSASANPAPFEGIVFHHTADDTTHEGISNYMRTVDDSRGGAFGYHFTIGPDGRIFQEAPLSKRTNHVLDQAGLGLSNRNSIGVSLVASDSGATPAQIAAAEQLSRALTSSYGIGADRIFGHVEVQPNKEAHEGVEIAERIRQMLAQASPPAVSQPQVQQVASGLSASPALGFPVQP